ncbi:hypothetical protein [Desulfonatronum thiodismutans]|uniref:hypothetical protein n=1 Tax=Desulfonatronum thiodismutans TaxID=159290 RepID=UPI0004ABE911|nr:hypothetical protein [Desulfonatronum thiodismutans]
MFLLEWLLSSSFLWALAILFWRGVRGLGAGLDILSLVFLNLFLVSGAVMATGLAGVFSAHWLAGLSGAGLIVLLTAGRSSLWRGLRSLRLTLRRMEVRARPHPVHLTLLAACVTILLVRMGVHIWFLPPYIWDVNTYHLPKVAEWIQSASLALPHMPVKRVYWPGGFELVQAWWAVFPHHDAVIEAAGLPFYGLAVGAVYVLARGLGLGPAPSAWCAFAYALTPGLAMNAVSAKNDIAVAALYLFLAALWIRPVPSKLAARRWLLSFAAVCMGVGVKPTMVFIFPGLALIALLGLRKSDFLFIRHIRFSGWVLSIVLISLMLGGYWYARNAVVYGNPFHPTSLRVAEQVVTGRGGSGGGQQGSFSIESAKEDIRNLFSRKIFDAGGQYNSDLASMTGWGWFAFACGWPAVLFCLFLHRSFLLLAGGFLFSFLLLLGWVDPDPWNMRFAQWFPAIAALGVGVLLSHTIIVPTIRRALILLAIWTTMLNGLGIVGNGYSTVDDWRNFIQTPVKDRSSNAPLQRQIAERVPEGERMAFFVESNDRFYPLYHPDFSRDLVYPDDRSRGFAVAMREYGVRYLFFGEWVKHKRMRAVLDDDLENERLVPLGRGVFVLADEN